MREYSEGQPEPLHPLNCSKCGERAPALARYCGACGNPLADRLDSLDDSFVALQAAQKILRGGDLSLAIQSLEVICVGQPQWPSALLLLGIAYLRAGRVHDAQDTLEAAENLAPDSFACQVAFAELHARLGFHDLAVERLDRALALPAPDLRARDVAVDLHRYCSERARKMFYRTTPLPRWTSFLRRRRERHAAVLEQRFI